MNVIKFMRLFKLLRLFKIKKIKAKYEDLWYNDKFTLLTLFLKIFVLIFYVAHTMACLFWMIGMMSMDESEWGGPCWITRAGIMDEDITTLYVSSLYWAFTTTITIGYGDISANNNLERIYVICSMVVMVGTYAFTLSTIGKRVQEYNRLFDTFRQNMLFLKEWMSYHSLS